MTVVKGGALVPGPSRKDGDLRDTEPDREFRDFYGAQATRLKRLALALTADPREADDLVQEALLRAYRSWSRIREEDPGPYVRRTLANLHRNSLRRKVVERRHLRVVKAEVAPSHDDGVEHTLRVAAALRHLSPIQRAAVILRYYDDLSQADIARILDRPIGTVKSDLHRALRRLRPLLDEEGSQAAQGTQDQSRGKAVQDLCAGDTHRPHPRSQTTVCCATA